MSENKKLVGNYKIREYLLEAFSHFPEREAAILKLRYGLESNKTTTLIETGKIFNLSKERIRQVTNRAVGMIKARGHINVKKGELDHLYSILFLHIQNINKDLETELQKLNQGHTKYEDFVEYRKKIIKKEFGFYDPLYLDLINLYKPLSTNINFLNQ